MAQDTALAGRADGDSSRLRNVSRQMLAAATALGLAVIAACARPAVPEAPLPPQNPALQTAVDILTNRYIRDAVMLTPNGTWHSAPALVDIVGDGTLEIIAPVGERWVGAWFCDGRPVPAGRSRQIGSAAPPRSATCSEMGSWKSLRPAISGGRTDNSFKAGRRATGTASARRPSRSGRRRAAGDSRIRHQTGRVYSARRRDYVAGLACFGTG